MILPLRIAPRLDPGWLFLVAGLAALAATVLVPAQRDLDHARYLRDQALTIERHRMSRLARHEEFLGALERREPALVLSLAASQLNQIPSELSPLPGAGAPNGTGNASVFPALEPPALRLGEERPLDSLLVRLTSDNEMRLWLVVGGAMCVLLGLLPRTLARNTSPA